MPQNHASFASGLPLLSAIIGVTAARRQHLMASNEPVPQAIDVKLLIDTGASHTGLSAIVFEKLMLPAAGILSAHTPSTKSGAETFLSYEVGIDVPARPIDLIIPRVEVIAINTKGQAFDGILGRDILSECLLVYNGRERAFTLSV